ncbi:MAG: hypothetical protein LBQ45_01525 [Mycoplasmataceae bacterium]|nr:hypothetical protein [Mycoplasmataceae bacterium]
MCFLGTAGGTIGVLYATGVIFNNDNFTKKTLSEAFFDGESGHTYINLGDYGTYYQNEDISVETLFDNIQQWSDAQEYDVYFSPNQLEITGTPSTTEVGLHQQLTLKTKQNSTEYFYDNTPGSGQLTLEYNVINSQLQLSDVIGANNFLYDNTWSTWTGNLASVTSQQFKNALKLSGNSSLNLNYIDDIDVTKAVWNSSDTTYNSAISSATAGTWGLGDYTITIQASDQPYSLYTGSATIHFLLNNRKALDNNDDGLSVKELGSIYVPASDDDALYVIGVANSTDMNSFDLYSGTLSVDYQTDLNTIYLNITGSSYWSHSTNGIAYTYSPRTASLRSANYFGSSTFTWDTQWSFSQAPTTLAEFIVNWDKSGYNGGDIIWKGIDQTVTPNNNEGNGTVVLKGTPNGLIYSSTLDVTITYTYYY